MESGDQVHVLGAVRCMSLFCDFLDDLTVPKLAPSLFPALTRVFANDAAFGPETRRYACSVVKTCLVLLGALQGLFLLSGLPWGESQSPARWPASSCRSTGRSVQCMVALAAR